MLKRNYEAYNGRCKGCEYCVKVQATGGWSFFGCTHEPHKREWVVEVEECPKKERACKHCLGDITINEIGEEGCFCELTDHWQNITLGGCIGNCESEKQR